MQPVSKMRDLFLKIGFIITLALSFNPVDTYAEPVVISLPVVEETEWVLKDVPFAIEQGVNLELLNDVELQEVNEEVLESQISLFFRLTHYERLVEVHLNQRAPCLHFSSLLKKFYSETNTPDPEYEQWFIA